MSSGGGKGGKKVQVTEYFGSIFFGVCWGPVTAIRSVYIGEKLLIGTKITEAAQLNLDVENLHGGAKREGGARGALWVLMGTAKQFLPKILAAKMYRGGGSASEIENNPAMDGVEQTVPAYRDLCCLGMTEFAQMDANFRQAGPSDLNFSEGATIKNPEYGGFINSFDSSDISEGFSLGHNNPYLKSVWVEVTHIHGLNWYPETAYIFRDKADHDAVVAGADPSTRLGKPDVNPIHAIRTLMTNRAYAAGAPVWTLDDYSARIAADICFSERLGISFGWYEQMETEAMIQMICDHIQAMVFAHPRSGKIIIKMMRPDYVVGDLDILDASNCTISEISSRDATEVVNEVVVNWTNPETGEKETSVAQDPAAIADTGDIISETHDYHAFCRIDLADRAAYRDVLAKTSPVRVFKASVAGRQRIWLPGEMVRVNFPDEGLFQVPCRIGKVEMPPSRGSDAILHLTEDVFGVDHAMMADRTLYMRVRQPWEIKPLAALRGVSAPYYALKAQNLDATEGAEYALIMAAAAEPGTYEAEVYTSKPQPNGDSRWANTSDVVLSRKGFLAGNLEMQDTFIPSMNLLSPGQPIVPGQAILLTSDDREDELCVISSINSTGVQVRRGILDTIPRSWPAGTEAWVLPMGGSLVDGLERFAGETYSYGARPVTFSGTGSSKKEIKEDVHLALRSSRPYRPANVRINNTLWAGMGETAFVVNQSSVNVSWSTRNRLTEDAVILGWTESSVPPEEGQMTHVRLKNSSGAQVTLKQLATESSTTLDLPAKGSYTVEVYSDREGLQSFQKTVMKIRWT